ncbi:hypothetical protein DID88_002781 [Monilinia fructigena]|uniref:Uncharacterized protein n=1 Tax=Monilinia fructigena TaxID=38457 RepID=A0A395IQM2_9HELO|nr:hypothetical protein DID88_002781 [Monilinia fructigena]
MVRVYKILQVSRIVKNATSFKNTSPSKRKASALEFDDDCENVDPLSFESPKRSKAVDGATDTFSKSTNYFLTDAPPSPTDAALSSPIKPTKPVTQRKVLQARTQTPTISNSLPKSTPLPPQQVVPLLESTLESLVIVVVPLLR